MANVETSQAASGSKLEVGDPTLTPVIIRHHLTVSLRHVQRHFFAVILPFVQSMLSSASSLGHGAVRFLAHFIHTEQARHCCRMILFLSRDKAWQTGAESSIRRMKPLLHFLL